MEFPQISSDGTHHIFEGNPIYTQRFLKVREYKEPGVAAVCDSSGWYHISFFGTALYEERFKYVGDFCEDLAVVCDKSGNWFHIDDEGNKVEADSYLWVSDFSNGTAVVYHKKLGATHITTMEELLYNRWYYDARPFQEGRALVRDEKGWLFIDRYGKELCRADEPVDSFPRGKVCAPVFCSPLPEVLKTLEYDAAVLLIRHAERESNQRGEFGSLKLLTPTGEEAARAFGKALPKNVKGYSSPVSRCVKTAELIAGNNEPSHVLGSPSVYIISDDVVNQNYSTIPILTVIREYIKRGVLPGHVPIQEGTQKMLAFLKSAAEKNHITVCVTHDVFVAAFASTLSGLDFSDDKVEFLDGCILFRKGDVWYLWWRGKVYEV